MFVDFSTLTTRPLHQGIFIDAPNFISWHHYHNNTKIERLCSFVYMCLSVHH